MQEMIDFFEELAKELLTDIKTVFAERQLYVLFEPQLGCEAQTDHVFAKNVFPLFSQQICRLLDASLAKQRVKITEVFNSELETYNKLINANNDQLAEAMQEMQSREYMITSMQQLEPQFKERIEKEFRAMKREVQRLMGLLGQKAELSEMELLLAGQDDGGGGGGKAVRDLRSRVKTLSDQNQQLKTTIEQQIKQMNVLNASIGDLNADREKYLAQIAQLTDKIKELQPEMQETEMNTELDLTAMAGLADLFHSAPKQIEELKQRNQSLESVTDELRQENDKLTDENEDLKISVERLQEKLNNLDKSSSEASRDLRIQNQELQAKVLTMQGETERQTKALTEENESLKQKIEELQSQISSTVKKLMEQQQRADDLLAEKNKLTQQLISGGPKGKNMPQKPSSNNLTAQNPQITQKVEEIKQEFEQQLKEALQKQREELQLEFQKQDTLKTHDQEFSKQISKLEIKEVGIQITGNPEKDSCDVTDYSVLAKAAKMGINLEELEDIAEAQSDDENNENIELDQIQMKNSKPALGQRQSGPGSSKQSSRSEVKESRPATPSALPSIGQQNKTPGQSRQNDQGSSQLISQSGRNQRTDSNDPEELKLENEKLSSENQKLKAQISELQRLLSSSKQRRQSAGSQNNQNETQDIRESDLQKNDLENDKSQQKMTQAQKLMMYHPPPRRLSEQEQIEERNRQKQMIQDKIKLNQEQQKIEQQMMKYGKIFDDHGNSMLEKPSFLQNGENEAIVVQNSFNVRNVQTKEVEQEVQEEGQPAEKKTVKMIVLADKEEVEESTFFISLDGKRIIDQFGNELGHDGYMRNKTNNIIRNYKEKLLQQRKQLLAKLNRSSTTKNVLKGQKLDHYNRKMQEIRTRLLDEYNEKQKKIQKQYENHHYKLEKIYSKIPTIANIGFDEEGEDGGENQNYVSQNEQQQLEQKYQRPRMAAPFVQLQLQQQQLQHLLFGAGNAQSRIQEFAKALQDSGAMPQYSVQSSPQTFPQRMQIQDLPQLPTVQYNIQQQQIGQQKRDLQSAPQISVQMQSLYPQQTISLQQFHRQNPQQQQLLQLHREQKPFGSQIEKPGVQQSQQLQQSHSQRINFGQSQRSVSSSLGASQLTVSHFQQQVDLSNSQESVQNMHLAFSPETQRRLQQLMEARQNNIYKKKQMPKPSIINNYSILSQSQKQRLISEKTQQQQMYDKMVKIDRPE